MKASPTGPRPLTPCVRGLLVSLILAAPGATGAEPATLELVQTIPLEGVAGRLDHLGIDTKGKRLFVVNLSNNSLDVVDLQAGKLLDRLTGVSKPCCVERVPGTDPVRVLVSNIGDGTFQLVEVSKEGN